MRGTRILAGATALALLAACQSLPDIPDRRFAPGSSAPRYVFGDLALGAGNSDETLVLLTFSGGGARAASMAFGVLEALHATRIGRGGARRSLLDEVDVISSNSGGSFTAGFYGLYRAEMFRRGPDGLSLYERRYLKRRITRELLHKGLRNIVRINTSATNRSDVAAEFYGDTIFGNRTYGDLQRAGRPFVVINANDTTKQARFVFTQTQFDLICSRLEGYPVSRAVTASSAVDGIFAPIKLRNFAPLNPACPPEPRWVRAALAGRPASVDAVETPRDRLRLARLVRWYRTGEPYDRPPTRGLPYFVHLGDGGAMDNTGLWPILRALGSPVSDWGLRELIASGRVRRVLLVVVNAMPEADVDYDRRPAGPTVSQALRTAIDRAINTASRDAIRMSEVLFKRLRREQGRRVAFYGPVVIDFEYVRRPARRRCFRNIETALDISPDEVDALRQLAVRQLERDAAYLSFLKAMDGKREADLTFGAAGRFCSDRKS